MTIKIDRDAVLTLVENRDISNVDSVSLGALAACYPITVSPSGRMCCRTFHEENVKSVFFELTSKAHGELSPELDDTDDESTVSSGSCSTATAAKGVTFAEPLVTEVRFRPRTKKQRIRSLFYSYEETQR